MGLAKMQVVAPEEAPENAETRPEELRLLEAMLFASAAPLDEKELSARLPQGVDVRAALARLQEDYATRGVNLVRIGGKWTFRTAGDLSWLLSKEIVETRKLSRAGRPRLSCPISASTRSAICPDSMSSKARACSMDACRRASRCRFPPTTRCCTRTRTRSIRAISISVSPRPRSGPRRTDRFLADWSRAGAIDARLNARTTQQDTVSVNAAKGR